MSYHKLSVIGIIACLSISSVYAEKIINPIDNISHGVDLVSIDFPNGVNLSDVIKTIAVWTGKNFVLGQGVSGSTKISIISQERVTREEAYQAFLSALNIAGFTTVETGTVVKILSIANAKSSNIKTYYGANWAPATDEIINQVIPLHYIEVNSVINQLRPILGLTQYAPFTTTNSLILTDTGQRIRKILEVIKLLDAQTNQAQLKIIPINYSDAKDIANKINDLFINRGGTNIALQKAVVDDRTNSIILLGPKQTIEDAILFIRRLDKSVENKNNQALIRVRPLDYADAEKLAAILQALAQNVNAKTKFMNNSPSLTSPASPEVQPSVTDISGAKITADKSSNSLIIEGTKTAYDALETIIAQLDKRKAQVYVEANMLDLSINHDLNWSPSALGATKLPNSNVTVPFGFNISNSVPFTVQQTSATGANTAIALGAAASSNAILGILSNKTINIAGMTLSPGALIFALKSDASTNVLQTPSMMVADNEEANFQDSQEINVLATIPNPNSIGTVTSPQKYTATTSLKVTPQISRSDFINLKISVQIDVPGVPDPTTGAVTITKRSADSVVTVKNGQTAVLGGIIQNVVNKAESKVPLLGDIPIIGWLFKQVVDKKERASLTLLITPHIVRNSQDLARIYDENMQSREEFLRAFYGKK